MRGLFFYTDDIMQEEIHILLSQSKKKSLGISRLSFGYPCPSSSPSLVLPSVGTSPPTVSLAQALAPVPPPGQVGTKRPRDLLGPFVQPKGYVPLLSSPPEHSPRPSRRPHLLGSSLESSRIEPSFPVILEIFDSSPPHSSPVSFQPSPTSC